METRLIQLRDSEGEEIGLYQFDDFLSDDLIKQHYENWSNYLGETEFEDYLEKLGVKVTRVFTEDIYV